MAPGFENPLISPAAGGPRAVTPIVDVARDSSLIPGGNADDKVRVVSAGTPDRGGLAFAVRLQPMETQPIETRPVAAQVATVRTQSVATAAVPVSGKTMAGEEQKIVGTGPVPQEAPAVAEKVSAAGEAQAATAGRRRQAGDDQPYGSAQAGDAHTEGTAGVPPGEMAPQGAPSGDLRQEKPAAQTATLDTSPARLEDAAKIEPKPLVQPAPAREIKLEVTAGDRRVEVRLTDRGGEVRVAVRTPDNHLAGTLRENLPELATRLADTGLRTQAWHPAGSSAGEWRHTAETPSGGMAQDADAQSRGQGGGGQGGGAQGDAEQRQSKNSQEQQQHYKEKGKDFAWLMSSLR